VIKLRMADSYPSSDTLEPPTSGLSKPPTSPVDPETQRNEDEGYERDEDEEKEISEEAELPSEIVTETRKLWNKLRMKNRRAGGNKEYRIDIFLAMHLRNHRSKQQLANALKRPAIRDGMAQFGVQLYGMGESPPGVYESNTLRKWKSGDLRMLLNLGFKACSGLRSVWLYLLARTSSHTFGF
jgi:hypothetical protein